MIFLCCKPFEWFQESRFCWRKTDIGGTFAATWGFTFWVSRMPRHTQSTYLRSAESHTFEMILLFAFSAQDAASACVWPRTICMRGVPVAFLHGLGVCVIIGYWVERQNTAWLRLQRNRVAESVRCHMYVWRVERAYMTWSMTFAALICVMLRLQASERHWGAPVFVPAVCRLWIALLSTSGPALPMASMAAMSRCSRSWIPVASTTSTSWLRGTPQPWLKTPVTRWVSDAALLPHLLVLCCLFCWKDSHNIALVGVCECLQNMRTVCWWKIRSTPPYFDVVPRLLHERHTIQA